MFIILHQNALKLAKRKYEKEETVSDKVSTGKLFGACLNTNN